MAMYLYKMVIVCSNLTCCRIPVFFILNIDIDVLFALFWYFSATPRAPTVFPLIQCGSATVDTVTLGCLATHFTPSPLTYSWSQNGAALTDFIQYPSIQNGDFYTKVSQIQLKRQDWEKSSDIKCAAAHSAGNTEITITKPSKINIYIRVWYK